MLSVFPDLIKTTFAGESCDADADVGDALIDSMHVSSSKSSSNNYKESNQTFHSMGRIFHYILALVNMEGPNTMYQEQTHFITADIHTYLCGFRNMLMYVSSYQIKIWICYKYQNTCFIETFNLIPILAIIINNNSVLTITSCVIYT